MMSVRLWYAVPAETSMITIISAKTSSRKKGEYSSAAEMYSFMLEKEPDNFRALNGLMLCQNKINALSDVTTLLNKGTFTSKTCDFEKFKTNCPEDKKAYFETAEDIIPMLISTQI